MTLSKQLENLFLFELPMHDLHKHLKYLEDHPKFFIDLLEQHQCFLLSNVAIKFEL